jgi:hypothetical protein
MRVTGPHLFPVGQGRNILMFSRQLRRIRRHKGPQTPETLRLCRQIYR